MVFDREKGIHSSNQNEHVDEEESSDDDDDDDDDDVTTYIYDLDHPPPESRPYACPVCGKRYVQKYFLIAHMDIHNYEKKFECYICKQSFWLERDLFKHMNTRCGRDVSPVHEIPPHRRNPNAKQSGSTARKKKVRDSKRDNQVDGKDCARHVERSAASSKSSPSNIRRESKTYSCPECYREFRHKNNLTMHLRIHSGEKPFECGVCKKAFSQSNHLTRHLRIHNEKPYECGVCDKAFSQSSTLTSHLRIHNGEKPFACDICKKTFRQKTHIRKHMNIHIPNSKRIYKCKVCMKVFHQRHILSEHRKDHEEES
ncbi:zinc finger protein OZF-like isoform X15 [Bradysia coprophila]|uniref:zinc finger protein OZF-like isoform X15 n=1 Tax=Bradysia coprophila TaxID=38358 RepID=UPI00187D6EAC|nr:zinc finger protein OZF-like isoform X15 [Bradysia coprophila]